MKNSQSDIAFRRSQILAIINSKRNATVAELADELDVSPVTIRRDLISLGSTNCLRRTHGGAETMGSMPGSGPVGVPCTDNLAKIGAKAAEFVSDDDIILLNTGRTTLQVIKSISKHAFAVTSNAYALNLDLAESPLTLIFTGGELRENGDSFTGAFAINQIDMVSATKCFLGVNALSAKSGLTSSSLSKIMINNRMIERCSGPIFVVAEGYKIGKTTHFHVCPISKIDYLITDETADEEELNKIREAGVNVIIV